MRPDLAKRKAVLEKKLRTFSDSEVRALANRIKRARDSGEISQREYEIMRGIVEKEVERRRREKDG